MKYRIMIYGLLSLLLIASLDSAAATVQAEGQGPPPDDCLIYSYVSFSNRSVHTLVMDNSTVFGNYLSIYTDCAGSFNVSMNGAFLGEFKNQTRLILQDNMFELELYGDDWSVNYSGIQHLSEQDFIQYDAMMNPPPPPDFLSISPSDLEWDQVKVSFFTGLIVWVIVQYVLWVAVNNWVDRYHCSEVA